MRHGRLFNPRSRTALLASLVLLAAACGGGADSTTRTADGSQPSAADSLHEGSAIQRLFHQEPVERTLPAGTAVPVRFLDSLSSETSQAGDSFSVRVTQDLEAGGKVAVPAGSTIHGEVTEAVAGHKIGGQAKLALDFRTLELAGGDTVPIDATFASAGKSEKRKDAAIIGGGTVGGAILGHVIRKDSKGAILGALVGAAAGTAIAAATNGQPVEIPAGAVIDLTLNSPLTVRLEG